MSKSILMFATLFLYCSVFAYSGGRTERRDQPEFDPHPVEKAIDVKSSLDRDEAVPVEVAIRTFTGIVTIRGGDAGEVRVTGLAGADVEDVDLRRKDDGGISIEVVLPDTNNYAGYDLRTELEVVVPVGSSLDVSGLGADISVIDVNGRTAVATMVGGILIRGEMPTVFASSVSGAIDISGALESVNFVSSMGDVILSGVYGELIGRTMRGSISVGESVLDYAELASDMGDITIDATVNKNGRVRASSTFGGRITLMLQPEVEALFTLTSNPDTIDISGFKPDSETEWIFSRAEPRSPVSTAMDALTNARISGLSEDGVRLRTPAEGEGTRSRILGKEVLEFATGSGEARVFVESQFIGRVRSADSNGDESTEDDIARIVLRTR